MSREIKFRAWVKEEKEYYYNAEHTYDFFCSSRGCYAESFGEVLDQPDRFIVEQYTGLKDKNGKEVYEGDVVKMARSYGYRSLPKGALVKVVYDEEELCYKLKGRGEFRLTANKAVEVVGNIHENPESLKGEE